MNPAPLVIILMGSKSDAAHCEKIAEAAHQLGLEVVQRIGSAHKTPAHVKQLLAAYEADPRPKVYITVAGRSNALSGFTDGAVSAPVIAPPGIRNLWRGGYLLLPAHAFRYRPGGRARTGQCRPVGRQNPGINRSRPAPTGAGLPNLTGRKNPYR